MKENAETPTCAVVQKQNCKIRACTDSSAVQQWQRLLKMQPSICRTIQLRDEEDDQHTKRHAQGDDADGKTHGKMRKTRKEMHDDGQEVFRYATGPAF